MCKPNCPFLYFSFELFSNWGSLNLLRLTAVHLPGIAQNVLGCKNNQKKESYYPQKTPMNLAEADSTVLDKTKRFGSTVNGTAVAPPYIEGPER